jgi:hypothetical protein
LVEHAGQVVTRELVRTNADKKVLLLEREHISMSDTEILAEIEKAGAAAHRSCQGR